MIGLATFGQQIELTLRNMAKPAERKAEIARVANDVLREAQDANRRELGEVPEHQTFVDGQKVAHLGNINPDKGTIAFVFSIDALSPIVLATHKMLMQNSPVLSGAYRDSHRILADGLDVTDAMPLPPAECTKVKEWVLLNPLPYSRKIEAGGMKMRVPGTDAVYEAVAALMSRRAGRKARIWFTYRSSRSAYAAGSANRAGQAGAPRRPVRRKTTDTERQSRVPAIIIRA